ncbi:MAG: hypothetical protein J3R72DRAFT_443818 [Linnemannia gamsii]|nr:MAG: hypothetical protein J3R72DRAFT_443818 [Linnemannia gamsii]
MITIFYYYFRLPPASVAAGTVLVSLQFTTKHPQQPRSLQRLIHFVLGLIAFVLIGM